VMESSLMTQPCARCGTSRYRHLDHVHEAGNGWPNTCPFGDCGNFQNPLTAVTSNERGEG
jgi:hypothetical protein